MAITSNTYTGNGSNKLFSITFPYIDTTDVDVYLNGVLQTVTTQYTFANATTVEFVAAPGNGVTVVLQRSTQKENLNATFFPGSSIKAADLNENFDQLLYISQENTGVVNNLPVTVTMLRWKKTATAGQTVLTGTDDNAISLVYTAGFEQVYVNGAHLTRSSDYTASDGATITMSVALTVGDLVEVMAYAPTTTTSLSSTGVTFTQSGTGAVTRNVDSKLKEVVSAVDFGAIGDGSLSTSAMLTAVTAAWNAALAAGKDLFFPAGTYTIGNANFPWRQGGSPTTLLDCKNITIFGEGPATIFKTISPVGADVFQLNGVKNLHFRNLAITAELTGFSAAGSNGISITAGFDNITIHDVYIYNLPSLDKTTYADGGKALTLQLANNDTLCGSLSARIRVKNCLQGLGFEPYLHRLQNQPCSIKVQLQAEKCYQGVIYNAPAATSALNSGFSSGLQVDAILTNCQRDVVLSRAHGCDVRATVVTTESKTDRTKNGSGVVWLASDTVVEALVSQYSHNSQIRIDGYKGNTDYKARIGGAAQGSSGLSGATLNSNIYLDISGTSATADILPVDSGGNTLRQSKLVITSATSASVPSDFADVSKKNVFETIGEYGQAIVPGNVRFPATQVSSADPNTFDDYEEGAWTPSFSISGSSSATFTITRGRYVKVGSHVHAWFSATRNDASALSGSVTWTLPFPTAEATAWSPVGTYWAIGKSQGIVVVDNFVNNIANGSESTTGGTNTYLSYATLTNGSNLSVSMNFITDT